VCRLDEHVSAARLQHKYMLLGCYLIRRLTASVAGDCDLSLHRGFPQAAAARGSSRVIASRWSRKDYFFVPLGLLLTLTLAAAMGHSRIFWEDELLGWMMLRDPSWQHMLSGWLRGVDGGGFLFYITGRLWFHVFGPSVLSFRMYSASGFAIALAAIWAAARRFYPSGVASFAVLITWFGSPVLVQALCEGRFYGLLMASDAVAVYLYFHLADRETLSWHHYLLVFASHACLVTSHLLGIFYSTFIVLAIVLLDLSKRLWRPRLYLAAVLPTLLLIPCLPAIRASAAVGKPHFWSSQPSVALFLADYSGFSFKLGILLASSIAILWVRGRTRGLRRSIADAVVARKPIYVYTAVIFLLPFLFLVEGIAGPSLCIPRYLLPTTVGTIFLIAETTTLAESMMHRRRPDRYAVPLVSWVLFLALLLIYDFVYLPRYNARLHKDYTAALTSQLPKGIPVVCEDAFAFTELVSLQHGSDVLYTFLLDWKTATAPAAPRVEVTQYHLMENWKNHGFFSGSIHDREKFLRQTPNFYTISFTDLVQPNPLRKPVAVGRYPGIGNPLHAELEAVPRYRVSLYKVLSLEELNATVWYVCRRDGPQCQ
jgi:hypothetical protein